MVPYRNGRLKLETVNETESTFADSAPQALSSSTFEGHEKRARFCRPQSITSFLIFVHIQHIFEQPLRLAYKALLHERLSFLLPPLPILTSAIIYFWTIIQFIRKKEITGWYKAPQPWVQHFRYSLLSNSSNDAIKDVHRSAA